MVEPEKRRRRPPVSCTLCRKRKIRCNRELPCNNCVRSKAPGLTCTYDKSANPPPKLAQTQTAQTKASPAKIGEIFLAPKLSPPDSLLYDGDAVDSETEEGQGRFPFEPVLVRNDARSIAPKTSPGSVQDVDTMRSRIVQLEDQLLQLRYRNSASSSTVFTTNNSTTSPEENQEATAPGRAPRRASAAYEFENEIFGQALFTSRSVMHKKRLFGQSHWANCLAMFRDVFEVFEPRVAQDMTSKISERLSRCKELARIIKADRAPRWPAMPTYDLPPKEVCDQLVDGYIRTSESVYRVLHIPSFMKEYNAIWSPGPKPDMTTIVTIKLVLAIGATVYDEKFSMRKSTVHWIHEAETWHSRPDYKARIFIRDIQIWNTILELALQTSLLAGAAPLISPDDYDTQPPGNFDDDQLLINDPETKPDTEFTQMSIARALCQTFEARLGVARYLNDLGSRNSYEETLRRDAELRAAHRLIGRQIQMWKAKSTAGLPGPSTFQLTFIDNVMRQTLLVLHVPFYGPSIHEASFAFTRKVVSETCLAVWRASSGWPVSIRGPHVTSPPPSKKEDFAILAALRSGIYGTMQASFLLLAEIRAQIREYDDGLGATPIRSDMLPVIDEIKDLSFEMIVNGETNIKGTLVSSLIIAQIKALLRGLTGEAMHQALIESVLDTSARCLEVLEKAAAEVHQAQGEDKNAESEAFALPRMNQADQLTLDWDFTIPETDFETGAIDPSISMLEHMNWMFDDEILQGPPVA
uniref:Zn(2)-C6 fungal-type domain-containing protein n=1 Tax=Bionectria ochroleuca TaxID=29856 RepID=A0A0B7K9M3_BIOOC